MDLIEERFWKRVNITDDCWFWIGSTDTGGYGQLWLDKATPCMKAHRISWYLSGNSVPEGQVIRHKCRNRNCVNPEHLETGTYQENCLDKERDGTTSRGEKIGTSLLTEQQVFEIRARSSEVRKELAKEYNVSHYAINAIIQRRNWRHL